MSDQEKAAARADVADDLVRRVEAVISEIYSMKSLLFKQKDTKPEDRTVDYFVLEPLQSLFDRATEPLGNARKLLAIEAYDQRRRVSR